MERPEVNRPLGDPSVDGRIILEWISRKWDLGVWTGSSWLRIETGGGFCENFACTGFWWRDLR
jgi:hypothetical protein